jgi:D-inositol-3-phosphate glycosyltransferase
MLCLTDDPLDPPGWERFGGGHSFVFDLGRYLVRLGWHVHYLTRRNAPAKRAQETLGTLCTITRIDVGPPEDLAPFALFEYLDAMAAAVMQEPLVRERFDVIHSHNWLSGAVARRIVADAPTRHVHSVLSLGRVRLELGENATEADAGRDALELEVFEHADMLVTVAASERDDLRRLYPEIQHDHFAIVPYGVDPDIFYPRPECPDDYVRGAARRSSQGHGPVP